MKCPKCKRKLQCEIFITGGCSGHMVNEICECPMTDFHANFSCNYGDCSQMDFTPDRLKDRESIAKWLENHYDGK